MASPVPPAGARYAVPLHAGKLLRTLGNTDPVSDRTHRDVPAFGES